MHFQGAFMNKQLPLKTRRHMVLGGLASAALVGCGGGGDDTSTPSSADFSTDLNADLAQANANMQQRAATSSATSKLYEYWNALFVQGGLMWTNGNEALIHDGNQVKSEGQGYGMMICVMMGDATRFNKIWNWTRNHMRHSSGGYAGRFAWLCNAGWSGWQGVQPQSAPDGEIWIATALHLAADRGWGGNLRADANALCSVLLNSNPGGNLLPFFNRSNNLVNFVPETWSNYTDPSYATPAFFSYLGSRTGNGYWHTLAASHRTLMQRATAVNGQGLAADFTDFNGRPIKEQLHSYDAWRVTMNQTLDLMWNGNGAHIGAMKKALGYMGNGLRSTLNTRCSAYYPAYAGGSYTDIGQVAMYATGSRGGAPGEAQPFVDRLLNSGVTGSYYQGLLAMLSLLILSGKFVK
jgi:oligosaccharide reducing-end xylanase